MLYYSLVFGNPAEIAPISCHGWITTIMLYILTQAGEVLGFFYGRGTSYHVQEMDHHVKNNTTVTKTTQETIYIF